MKSVTAVLLLCAAVFASVPARAEDVPGKLAPALAGLAPDDAAKVAKSAAAFLKAPLNPERSTSELGWDCLAAARLTELGVDGARERLGGIADQILAEVQRAKRGNQAIGWTNKGEKSDAACVAPTARTSLAQNSCQGAGKPVYAFQTGLGMACLAKSGALLQRKADLAAANETMSHWDKLRMPQAPCPDCIFFATSDSATDEVRYVRNMNLFIAFGAAELGAATQNNEWKTVARQAAKSDAVERGNGNRGYLGTMDPLFAKRADERERIENHSASVAMLLNVMGQDLGESLIGKQARTVWQDWGTCGNKRCQSEPCGYWAGDAKRCQSSATAAHCAFRFDSPVAKDQCDTYLSRVPSLGTYGLWAVLQARKP